MSLLALLSSHLNLINFEFVLVWANFRIAVFTDEAYSILNPFYTIISSPIIKYNASSAITDYEVKCALNSANNMKDLVEEFNETPSTLSDFETDFEFSTQPSSGQISTSIGLFSETLLTDSIATSTMLNSSIQALPEFTTAIADTAYSTNSSILINLVGRLTNCSYLNADLINGVKIRVSLCFFFQTFDNIFFIFYYLKIFKLESLYKSVANFKDIEVTNVISNE